MYWTVRWSGEQCTRKSAILSLMATDDERRMEKYRVLVNRVDTSKPDWPDRPVSQQYNVVKNQAGVNKTHQPEVIFSSG
ncbi:hypothetical protein GIT61_06385 [Salmonella enterica]|uniref:Tail fiber assembly protein n=1 Tax=Salmonella derby TaxID=28144 RepID=A0A630KUF0_SALDE|nr:hypothetical protein [Salmonella enterica subsp. enterica serovar Derby]EEM6493649.1 hypothetical protein [Salmonella enterica]EDG4923345.1 hypothetical protein [Salmonella enterica subsp. enterica serovar Derby]EDG4925958.1 hypothetical protein [Salmonella enterica subsp. enterica serovar Derby]EDG5052543.1 hypothetical protein [Salmonella enterica subsp. enterica serovar Derby]